MGHGPSLLNGARPEPTLSFWTAGSSPGRNRGLWPTAPIGLSPLGRFQRSGTFGPLMALLTADC
jgi:hypothetical protein